MIVPKKIESQTATVWNESFVLHSVVAFFYVFFIYKFMRCDAMHTFKRLYTK